MAMKQRPRTTKNLSSPPSADLDDALRDAAGRAIRRGSRFAAALTRAAIPGHFRCCAAGPSADPGLFERIAAG